MAAPPSYTFARGAPIVLGRRVLEGDPTGYDLIADVKPAKTAVPAQDVEPVATFAVEFHPATGDQPAYWLLTLSEGLPAGTYATDCRVELDGQVVHVTRPAFIVVNESVSG